MEKFLMLLLIIPIVFLQNMAFTWTSRSRNSGDPDYHRKAAYCSNGIWYICYVYVLSLIWKPLTEGNVVFVLLVGLIYTMATAEGSVFMMKLLLGKINIPFLTNFFEEKKKERVGER
jgi:hypothetical protein